MQRSGRGQADTAAACWSFCVEAQQQRLLDAPGQAVWSGGRDLYGPLQSSIRKAAGQLAPFAAVGIPLVIVVTNPLGADVDFDPDDVVSALFGQVKLSIDIEEPHRTQPTFSGEDGAVLHRTAEGGVVNRLPHVSAVVALYGVAGFERVDVYDLAGARYFSGTRLPAMMFDGKGARRTVRGGTPLRPTVRSLVGAPPAHAIRMP